MPRNEAWLRISQFSRAPQPRLAYYQRRDTAAKALRFK